VAADAAWGIARELVVTGGDFPWLSARIRAMPGLEAVRPLFAEELRALEHVDDDLGSWQAAYDRIRRAVSLLYPDGRPVPEFLLHVDGEDAWWRWSDEPFAQAEVETLAPATLTLVVTGG
jgi:hypothetical protein